jgi:hypothetical protein
MCPRIASLTFLALFLAGTGFSADPKDKDKEKAAVPEAADQQKAEKTIKELFQAEYAKTKQADRLALANKLLMEADGSNDDPAAKYVLLREARDLAAKAGDAGLAMTAVDAMAAAFDVKPAVIKVEALEVIVKGMPASAARDVTDSALSAVDDAMAADDYEIAARLVKVAATAASRTTGTAATNLVKRRTKDVEATQKEFERVKKFVAKLADSTEDPEANLEVGRFFCFYKGDWEKGLPLLAKGKDEKLKAQAVKDTKTNAIATEMAETADGWWDLADKQPDTVKDQLQLRAHYWYEQALPELAGLAKSKAEKRESEVQKLLEARTGAKTSNSGGWTVLFRSANPAICGRDYNGSTNNFAVSLKKTPEKIEWLRLTAHYKKDYVIIPMTRDRLPEGGSEEGGIGWQGRSDNRWKGYHLGIYRTDTKAKDRGEVVIAEPRAFAHFKGWGFGHHFGVDDRQGYSWDGKEIPPSVFEIAVKAGQLSPAEMKKVLGKKE